MKYGFSVFAFQNKHHSILGLFFLLLLSTLHGDLATHPNILIIIADDQGWGDLSCHGNQNFQTPNLDQLSKSGVSFDRFYVEPVCSPTRAELLTGRYALRCGISGTSQGDERLDLDEVTIASYFKNAGYRTGLFGKWHNGSQYPYHPLGRGFEQFYGFTSGHWGLYFDAMIDHNGAITTAPGFLSDAFTQKSIGFMEASLHANIPFFTILSFNIPHSPMQVPEKLWEKYQNLDLQLTGTDAANEDKDHTRAALALVENIDVNVGKIVEFLQKAGAMEDTIIVYLSDNGPNGHRWNGTLKGIKGSGHEGGVRSPLFISWEGAIPKSKSIPQMAAVIDLAPTLFDLAGISIEPTNPLDGISLKPAIFNTAPTKSFDERTLFSHWHGRTAVRTQSFLYHSDGELYNLADDPAQKIDIANKEPKLKDSLQKLLQGWTMEMESEITDSRFIPIGHPEFSMTYLPARDAVATGAIQRSNRWPNDSFFRNWIHQEDQIQWPVNVLSEGWYMVDIWYGCAPGNIGCEIELSCAESKLNWTVLRAHEAKPLGESYTRSELHESIVKDFRVDGMGAVYLRKGNSMLTLSSPHIQGTQSIEFRMLRLTKI